jgi:signal transduction histidine kinase
MADAAPELQHGQPDTASKVRVLVVDDNEGFRDSLATLLDVEELEVVGEAATGEEALALAPGLAPDVVLMDVRMPAMDGVEATTRLKSVLPAVGVVALTGHEDQRVVRDMLVAGASGFVLKDSDGEDILTAIRQAAHGGGLISPEVTPTVIEELTEALERERRRARELEQAQQALVERAERRHEHVARLGHELRTPVTVILGMAQTLAKHRVPEGERRELLERLAMRAESLARLVERFELAADAALTERIDVAEVAREIGAKHERVEVRVDGEIPPASLNPVVARRLLDELVDNALRFSPPGSPVRVEVSPGRTGVEVRVTDCGSGIDAGAIDRIFDAFEQAEPLNARRHQGAGVGLSLARAAARAADGDVLLERTGPDGSVFLWTIASPD